MPSRLLSVCMKIKAALHPEPGTSRPTKAKAAALLAEADRVKVSVAEATLLRREVRTANRWLADVRCSLERGWVAQALPDLT